MDEHDSHSALMVLMFLPSYASRIDMEHLLKQSTKPLQEGLLDPPAQELVLYQFMKKKPCFFLRFLPRLLHLKQNESILDVHGQLKVELLLRDRSHSHHSAMQLDLVAPEI